MYKCINVSWVHMHITSKWLISLESGIMSQCCDATETLKMMGKLSNGSTTRYFYSNIFIRPYFLGRGAKGGNDQWNYVVFSICFNFFIFGQRTRRGRCPIEQRGDFPSLRGGHWLSKGRRGLAFRLPFVCSLARTDGRKFPPLFYRTSSPSGPLPNDGEISRVP